MNREMRRIQEKDEERARRRRAEGKPRAKERVGFRQYLREVRQEMKRVAWPTRDQTITYTVVVLAVTTIVGLLTFGLDFAFKTGVLEILSVS
ncbi:MAG: preprotein translocase subunit SecE [Actinomycetota bacterium]|nr:preprotein translocase subunit SecE [Actinomycetota bacterium]